MEAERFARLKALVAEAAELYGPERAGFLDTACGEDTELRREAESLLAHHEAVPTLLSPTGLDGHLVDALEEASMADTAPAQLGPYTINAVLGEGGMGIVYAATQEAPLHREVAIKLVTGGRSAGVLARFEAERRTLARLDHPAIARVYDAGSAPDGRPYFVMERVRGRPITSFADAERLSTRERLDLFLAVCAGVQHAHQKGVIHRDLKPSNVLVARESDGPRPRIIDFGIALAVEDPDWNRLTQTGHLLGTPDYMSPEQAGVLERDVDTRTDVYALGVILYQLLCGTRPHRFSRPTPAEIHRVMTGPPPRRPSAVVTEDEATAAAVSEARRSTPDRLGRLLRGDLDNIALKALAREPDSRYASVEQLARDVRRHLAGLPVEARAASWSYRAGKFARRHSAAVAGMTAVILLLSVFGGVSARQARVLQKERDRARREAETARQVSSFLAGMFRDADPSQSKGAAITAREILDRGATRIRTELAGQPAVQARLLSTMGDVYLALGLYEPAASLLEQALARQEALSVSDPAELATTLDRLGGLAHDLRDMKRSEDYSRRALDLRRRSLGPEHPDVAESLINVAIAVRGNGRPAEAETLYREGVALHRKLFGSESERLAWALFNFAWALHQQGRLDDAEPLYVEAAALQRRLLGDTHPELRDTLNSMAGVYYQRGQYERAGEIWEEALAICRRLHGDSHTATARAHSNLARVPLALGDYTRAESLSRRAVEINLATIGPDHPHTASTQHALGVALWRLGRLVEAERSLRDALAVRERTAGKDSPLTGATLAALALVVSDAGRRDGALALARRAASIGEAQAARWPSAAAGMLESLATLLAAGGEAVESVPFWRRALSLRESTQDSSPVERALASAGLGRAELDAGEPAGLARLRAASQVLESHLPAGHPDRVRVRSQLQRAGAGGS
jgi:serine/threonine protein kinase/tetratricopeptide (TPR) repeat protein